MSFENVYTIKLIPTKRDRAFELTGSEGEIIIVDYIGKRQFSLYQNNRKTLEAKNWTDFCEYFFKYNNKEDYDKLKFYSKSALGNGYKVTREKTAESNDLNWTWAYSSENSSYTLINKNLQDLKIAKINGLSLDGQDSGMLCISQNIPKDHQIIIIMTACIIWNRNLLSPWNNFVNFLSGKK